MHYSWRLLLLFAITLQAFNYGYAYHMYRRRAGSLSSVPPFSANVRSQQRRNCPLFAAANEKKEIDQTVDNYKDDLLKSVSWAAAASGFAALIALWKGQAAAVEFTSGYLLELCLSVDNLFVFLILFDYFKVDDYDRQSKVLKYGILGAIVLRGLFISVGSFAITQYHQVLSIFAGFLAYSAYKILASGNGNDDDDEVRGISNS